MPKKILIVKNISREGPGLLAEELSRFGLDYEEVDLSRGEDFPPVKAYRAVILLGGPDSANDQTSKMQKELERACECLRAAIPILGICLGLQVLVKAAGGKVVRNPVKEIGFKDPAEKLYQIELTGEGLKSQIFRGLPAVLPAFQLHGETVELTPEMTLLARGRHCLNQVVQVAEKAYGLQGHLELTESLLECWLREDDDLKQCDADKLRSEFKLLNAELHAAGRKVFQNFLAVSDLL